MFNSLNFRVQVLKAKFSRIEIDTKRTWNIEKCEKWEDGKMGTWVIQKRDSILSSGTVFQNPFSNHQTDASSITEITRFVGSFGCGEVAVFSCSNRRCRFILQSASCPLLSIILSSSTDAFSCEISGMTWAVSDSAFLLLRMMEPRFGLRVSLGTKASDTLLSSSLIEYFIWWKEKLIYYYQTFQNPLNSYPIAWSDDFFIVVIIVEVKVIENIVRKIHVWCIIIVRDQFKKTLN